MFSWIRDRFRRGPVVPVVRLSGVIAAGSLLGSRGLSIESTAPLLAKAFKTRGAKAVALSINSPGGSPVQSALIAQRIRLLAQENGLPVLAFVEDVAASGGYWLACAADEIVADPASIVGSIGVVSSGFGFHELIARYGIERRVHTSGESKSMLDPFKPEKAEDVERLGRLQA
jgi:signal peptide peptidase SppA